MNIKILYLYYYFIHPQNKFLATPLFRLRQTLLGDNDVPQDSYNRLLGGKGRENNIPIPLAPSRLSIDAFCDSRLICPAAGPHKSNFLESALRSHAFKTDSNHGRVIFTMHF